MIENMEIDLDRCPVCERREVTLAELNSQPGSKYGLQLKWVPQGIGDVLRG